MIRKLTNYYENCRIRTKVNILTVGVTGVIFLLLFAVISVRTHKVILEKEEELAGAVGEAGSKGVSAFLNEQGASATFLARSIGILEEEKTASDALYESILRRQLESDTEVFSVWYIRKGGLDSAKTKRLIASKDEVFDAAPLLSSVEMGLGFAGSKEGGEVWISDPINIKGAWFINVATAVKVGGEVVGVVGVSLQRESVEAIVRDVIRDKDGLCKVITNSGVVVDHYDKTAIGKKNVEGDETDAILARIQRGDSISRYLYSRALNDDAYKIFIPIIIKGNDKPWSFCTVFTRTKMLADSKKSDLITLLIVVVGLLILIFMANFLSRKLTTAVVKVSEQLALISEGRLGLVKEINIKLKNELGDMINALNRLTGGLKGLANFAMELGRGNLDIEAEVWDEHDIIGKSMVELKQNLIAARDADEQRRAEDEIRSWKVAGSARIHEVIRVSNSDIKTLCTTTIKEIIAYVKGIQAGIYVVNDEDKEDHYVELMACIAYNREKMMQQRIPIEEGLVGRCIYEKSPILLSEIPQNYLSITSGLGDKRPDFLALIPLVNNEEVVGVFEIATFNTFDEHAIEYLTKAAESLASAICNVRINERTHRLLSQTKQYAEEMGAQEEELRQNMEEMQAAQEEMMRQAKNYEETISQLQSELAQKA